jgi:hypothetical protein
MENLNILTVFCEILDGIMKEGINGKEEVLELCPFREVYWRLPC